MKVIEKFIKITHDVLDYIDKNKVFFENDKPVLGDLWKLDRETTYPNVCNGNPVVEISHNHEWMRLPKDIVEIVEIEISKSKNIDSQKSELCDTWEYIKEWKVKFGRLPKDEDELAACIDYVMKRQKQNSVWSEEDEEIRLDTIKAFQLAYPYATEEENPRKRNIEWLKSLKPNHWKPSEEQMRVLQTAIRDYGVSYEKSIFESLYNDLKSL